MGITFQQIIISIMITLFASTAPIFLKKYVDNNKIQDLIISFILFTSLFFSIYYSFVIKLSFLFTVILYKVLALIFLTLASSFIFKEYKITFKKLFALLAIIIGIYYLEN